MQSLRLIELRTPCALETSDEPQPPRDQVVVRLEAAALNRRDYWITQGMYPGIRLPVTLGSDGAGVVQQIGEDVDKRWLGQDVVINPGLEWGDSELAQSGQFQILGMPLNGTFATHVVVPATSLFPRPASLDWSQAAALPLAGVTAFRAVFTQGNVSQGQKVLVTGVGGGVATFAVQFAAAAGASVCVTSSSSQKLERAQSIGASCGFLYTEADWVQRCLADFGPPDLVIDSAGGDGYKKLLDVVKSGGRIVSYGSTAGPIPTLDMFKVFWKQLRLQGSTMGSPTEFAAMVDFVQQHRIQPVVDDVFPLSEGNAALAKMVQHDQFGKIVLSV
jgi:NADPH:quinone reductase-like Zn-dependent oxidoreductase